MGFLPDNYEIPSAQNGYMKFEQGENKFRILSETPIMGHEWWIDEVNEKNEKKRKPIRVRIGESIPVEFADSVKHFWAMVVFNYKTKSIQILEITQKGIMQSIRALSNSKGWGSPQDYDLLITRDGEGMETQYTVMPEPKEKLELTTEQQKLVKSINLEALYEGADPFQSLAKEDVIDPADLPF